MTTTRKPFFERLGFNGDRPASKEAPTAQTLHDWLVREVADQLKVPLAEVDPRASLLDYGLDSLQATAMAGRLERFLGRRLSPALLWDYPTVSALVDHLVAGSRTGTGQGHG